MNLTAASFIVAVVSGIIFLVSITRQSLKDPEVGDVFVHTNPGTGANPHEKPRPFVKIYKVEEIKAGSARISYHRIAIDGTHHSGEDWQRLSYLGQYDKKL